MTDSLVIIPTYNEKENVVTMLEAIMGLEFTFDVLIVDDGSPDGTAGLVKETAKKHPGRIYVLERKGKLGLGTAYIAGFKWALKKNYQFIFEMDCDFSHDPNDLIRLRIPCAEGGAGVTVGSRYVKDGGVVNWPFFRRFISKGASLYVNSILWLGVKDSTAGFVAYRREVLEAINLDAVTFIGYAFQIEMKYRAKRLGFKITEVPIRFCDRILGTSKMSLDIFNEAFLGVLKMRFLK
ncbi:MAG: dolichyl-phosphate beta-D-mannosyltransferase [Crocinitomicaceae bacterium]|nr:dolichyl-phosphate beta-D-mannosyltransferase [Crocinitomicaceae bacterium]|tara:strand:- start:24156 stop:24866 length:711 start_codon:yes stop_codon:yes gene_type:complete